MQLNSKFLQISKSRPAKIFLAIVLFLVAVYTMSSLRDKISSNKMLEQISLCIIGTMIIMALGFLWLAKFIGLNNAFYLGVVPFIIPGIVKSLVLVGFIRATRLLPHR